jgi:hypothetical protein
MKKYYSNLFQDNTNFRRKMRNIKLRHKMLIACSVDVSENLGISGFDKTLPFFLASIAFPLDMKKVLK